jgi:hypothetical protein
VIALFRANTRNAVILEKYLREKGAKALKTEGHQAPTIDPTDPDVFDRLELEQSGGPPSRQGNGHGRSTQERVPEEKRGWFSVFGRKKQPDVECGHGLQREDEPLPNLPTDSRRDKCTIAEHLVVLARKS